MSYSKTNEAIKRNSGKVGNIRYYVKAGKTYSRTASADVSNPRTLAQMANRCRLANIKAVYDVIAWHIRKCFESADAATSIYNLFTGRNHYVTPIYLTKQQKIDGYAIAAEYCISEGSLPPIKQEMSEAGILKSNIAVGNADIASMNIGQLSELILANNLGYKEGDSITFFALKQTDVMGTPYVKLESAQIVLKKSDANPLPSFGFELSVDGFLGADCSAVVGAYSYVHARKSSKKVSTQYLVANDMELIDQFSSDDQLQAAAESYGQVEEDAYIFGGESEQPEGMYRLTVQSEDTNKGTVSGGGLFAEGDNATFDAYPKSGYQFEGWYRNGEKFSSEAHVDEFDMPAANITVVAKFVPEAEMHTVSLTAGNNGKVKIGDGEPATTATGVVDDGGSVMISAVANSGFIFQKWSDNNMQNPRTLTNVTEDITLTATFESEE